MWIEEVGPEQLAEFLRHYYQALEVFRNRTEGKSCNETAHPGKNRLIAVAHLTLLGVESTKIEGARTREYFAKPGEAEWGC